MIKRVAAALIITILITAVLPIAALALPVSGWAIEEVTAFLNNNLMPAELSNSDFRKPINRANFCGLIMHAYPMLSDFPVEIDATDRNPFSDTNDPDVVWAYQRGIVSGTGAGQFSPTRIITRAEIAVMFHNLLVTIGAAPRDVGSTQNLSVFSDASEIPSWAAASVSLLFDLGIMQGLGGGFAPSQTATFEQAMIMINRLYRQIRLSPNQISNQNQQQSQFPNQFGGQASNQNAGSLDTALAPDHFPGHTPIYNIRTPSAQDNTGPQSINDNLAPDFFPELPVISERQPIQGIPGQLPPGTATPQTPPPGGPPTNVNQSNRPLKTIRLSNVTPPFTVSSEDVNGSLKFEWNAMPGAVDYEVTKVRTRISVAPIAIPDPIPMVHRTNGETHFTIDEVRPVKNYSVTVIGLDAAGNRVGHNFVEFETPRAIAAVTREQIYFNGQDTTPGEKQAAAATVTVRVWRLNEITGIKTSGTMTFQIHHALADVMVQIFDEIYNGSEQFPIRDIHTIRTASVGEHGRGTAIDINANENWYKCFRTGTTVGSFWRPFENPFSITPYGDVVTAFERHGFTWGGDSWRNVVDYMHFSLFGT